MLGGEVWLIGKDGSWQGTIPESGSSISAVWTWMPQPSNRGKDETWDAFCQRCLNYTLSVLKAIEVEKSAEPSCGERIRHNLTHVTEKEYDALVHQGTTRSAREVQNDQ